MKWLQAILLVLQVRQLGTKPASRIQLTAMSNELQINQTIELHCRVENFTSQSWIEITSPYTHTKPLATAKMGDTPVRKFNRRLKGPIATDFSVKSNVATFMVSWKATQMDAGVTKWICWHRISKSNELPKFERATVTVNVTMAPEIKTLEIELQNSRRAESSMYKEDDVLRVTCHAILGYPEAEMSIFFYKRYWNLVKMRTKTITFIHSSPGPIYSMETGDFTLTDQHDGAELQCSVRNRIGADTKQQTIIVHYTMRDIKKNFIQNGNMKFGDTIEYSARGNPTPSISFSLNAEGKPIIQRSADGKGIVKMEIPLNIPIGPYLVRWNATQRLTDGSKINKAGCDVINLMEN